MESPPPYPGHEKKEQKNHEFCHANLPPPPPYDGLEGQRIIITEAPMINVSTPNGQRLLIPPMRPAGDRIESYLFLSLFTLICCCFPLGLVATILSCQVGLYAQRGEIKKARYVSEKAKHIATIGILIGTFTVLYMFVQRVKFFDQMRFVKYDSEDLYINKFGNEMQTIPSGNESEIYLTEN